MQKPPSSSLDERLASAMRHHQAGQLIEAERLYQQILKVAPRHAPTLHYRGLLAHQQGNHKLALKFLDQALAVNPSVPAFHLNRGIVLSEMHRVQDAIPSFRRAIALNPQFLDGHYNLGASLQTLGQWEEAAASYARALALKPDFVAAQTNAGLCRVEQGRLDDAIAHFERALSQEPDFVDAHNGLGNALRQRGDVGGALASYQRAAALDPAFVQAYDNIGMLLLEQGRPADALLSFDQALRSAPEHAPALAHRGTALKELGRADEAAVAYRRAVELAPLDASARWGLAISVIPLMTDSAAVSGQVVTRFLQELDALASWSKTHLRQLGNAVGENLPFYLAYRPGGLTTALNRYGDLMCAAAALRWNPLIGRVRSDGALSRPSGERVRLAIVSGHVGHHPVWDVLLRGFLAQLDRHRIEIVFYCTAPDKGDEEAGWARAHVDRFVQGPKAVAAWVEDLAADSPDVVFYPEVGMDPTTSALAALRLAPLQIAAWGHPVTTGLPTMDAYLSGELLEAADAESHYREKLVRLPGTGVCTELSALRAAAWGGAERPAGVVRFALCQQPIKFDPAYDGLVARLAKSVGPSQFWLADPRNLPWTAQRLRGRLEAAFRAVGLDPAAHLRVMPWLPPAQFLGFLDEMDIYLDCPAFSGYTTAWQAVHRGLPIVTWEGTFLRQRLAAGLLRQIGRPEGIAASAEQYVSIAVALAEERRARPDAWRTRRAAIREAAAKADGNQAAVTRFERMLLDARAR